MKTILIVDASEPILGSLSLAIRAQKRDCAVLTASGGRDAVEIMKGFRIDLIITDIVAPAADGNHLIEYRNTHRPLVPLLRITTGRSGDSTQTLNAPDIAETLMLRIREKIDALRYLPDPDPVKSCFAC
jgi:DNA-binding response OmpR family regulator